MMKAILLTALLGIAAALAPMAEAKNIFYPVRNSARWMELVQQRQAAGPGKLLYYGGPVIGNTKVVAVLWGENVASDIKSGIADFYTDITKSDIMGWMDQYNTSGKSLDGRDGTNQHIGKGSFAGVVTISPEVLSGTIDDKAVQAEIQKQIDAGKLAKADGNTLFMIYFPPGMTITIEGMTSCAQFCAYHNAKGTPASDHFYYGVMPDLGGACAFGCGFGEHFGSVTAISSHEFCEAVTDPFPTPGSNPAYPQAWNDTQGSEVGDLCAGTSNTLTGTGGKTYKIQGEWDNAAGACTTKTWTAL